MSTSEELNIIAGASHRLVVDRIACDGAGLCAHLDPSSIGLDPWGYPIVSEVRDVDRARRAVRACPTQALRMLDTNGQSSSSRSGS